VPLLSFLLTQGGTLIHLDLGSFARQNLANTGVSFSSSSITPDIARIAVTPSAGYALGKQNGNPVLVAMTNLGQITTYPIANEPMSLTLNPAADHVFLLTGCPAGSACSGVPNRLYAFSIASQAFEQAGPDNFIPLQTLSHQIRFGPSGNKIYFDGVVAGADGIGQRFVFSLDAQGTAPQTARVAIPGVRWEPLSIVLPSSAPGQGTVPVPGGVPAGGGIGANNGGIATNPIPIDEIERQIGMPIALIDFSTITDEQIRAYGYDPAAVRRYVAQLKLQQATTGAGSGGSSAGTTGFRSSYSSSKARNCAVIEHDTDFVGTSISSSSNNATSNGTIGGTGFGTNAQVSAVASDEFENVTAGTEDFRLKSTSTKLRGNGTATNAPATDMFNRSWNGGVPDIGPLLFDDGSGGGGGETQDSFYGRNTRGIMNGINRGLARVAESIKRPILVVPRDFFPKGA
jgi:hypothetical protein